VRPSHAHQIRTTHFQATSVRSMRSPQPRP
jgi:hypothetical protein